VAATLPDFLEDFVTILVTGAAGFIGSHLTDSLLAAGHQVVGLDNFDSFYPRRMKEANLERARGYRSFELIEGDIRDRSLLDGLPEVSAIFHLAAVAGVRPSIHDPGRYADVNATGTALLLDLARERGVKTFVFASSSSVYGNSPDVPFRETAAADQPISPYAATKRAAELLTHAATHLNGTTTLCLRLFTVFGPRQRPDLAIRKFVELLSRGEPIPMFGDGTTARDYTFVSDTVDGLMRGYEWAQDHPGRHEVVNLGRGTAVSLQDMIQIVADELGVEARIERLPSQPGDARRTMADIRKARELLGYEPEVEFREGVRRMADWLDPARGASRS
jgi:UDP-glucuronate 4-epimerase